MLVFAVISTGDTAQVLVVVEQNVEQLAVSVQAVPSSLHV
jgi:hypothetical protein